MKSKWFLDIYGNPITCIHTSALLKWASLLSFADMLTWHLSGWSYHWCLSPALESVQDPNVMPNYLSIQVSETVIIHEKESEIGRMLLAPTHDAQISGISSRENSSHRWDLISFCKAGLGQFFWWIAVYPSRHWNPIQYKRSFKTLFDHFQEFWNLVTLQSSIFKIENKYCHKSM